MNNGKSINVIKLYLNSGQDCRSCEDRYSLCDSCEHYRPSNNVVIDGGSMRLGPYRGYYGRAVWNDATQRFEGWLICPDRVKFHSVKERNIVLNFEKAVNEYVEEEECVY